MAGCAGATSHRILVTLFFYYFYFTHCCLYLPIHFTLIVFPFMIPILIYCFSYRQLGFFDRGNRKAKNPLLLKHTFSRPHSRVSFSPALIRRFTRKTIFCFATIAFCCLLLMSIVVLVCRTRKDLRHTRRV